MEHRQSWQAGSTPVPVCEEEGRYHVITAVPILSEGDVLGSVLFLSDRAEARAGDVELKLAQTVAGFLGRHMET